MSTNEENIFDKPPDTVTINEVAFMHQIIQAYAQRGAFKPEEFKDVGALNDKLKALLEYARKLEEAAKKQSEQAESTSAPAGSIISTSRVSTSRVNTISTSRVNTIRII